MNSQWGGIARLLASMLALSTAAVLLAACEDDEARKEAMRAVDVLRGTDARLVYWRPSGAAAQPEEGALFMAAVDGRVPVQLSPSGDVSFVGLREVDGATIVYYLMKTSAGTHALHERDVAASVDTELLTFDGVVQTELQPSGSLSPNGDLIAFSHRGGVDVLELVSGRRRPILANKTGDCQGPGRCLFLSEPRWSPLDGRWLMVQVHAYEFTFQTIVDPHIVGGPEFQVAPSAGLASWSVFSDDVCHFGDDFQRTGLYVAGSPDWRPTNVLTVFEANEEPDGVRVPTPPVALLADCAWLGTDQIAVIIRDYGVTGSSEILVLDPATGAITLLASAPPDTIGRLVGGSDGFLVFNGCYGSADAQPCRLNFKDGSIVPLLQPGDEVLDLIHTGPVTVPPDLMPATLVGEPCPRLTVGCEAQVTNAVPGTLIVWAETITLAETAGQLSEGETVCLVGPRRFGDGFSWWFVRSEGGLEGWLSDRDPDAPDAPWLTVNGKKCSTARGGQ